MSEEYSGFAWWTAAPITEDGEGGAKQLTSSLFRNWGKIKEKVPDYRFLDVWFFGEDDADSGLIKTRAEISSLSGQWFVKIGSRFYELDTDKFKPRMVFKRTDKMPKSVLYTFTIGEDECDEDDLLVVTESYYLCDKEITPEQFATLSGQQKKQVERDRDFYCLTRASDHE